MEWFAKTAALFEIPQSRATVHQMAQTLHRARRVREDDIELSSYLEECASALENIMERTAPARSVREVRHGRDGPTPETKRKATGDPVRRLLDSGRFDAGDERKVAEVRRVFHFLSSRLSARTQAFDEGKPIKQRDRFIPKEPLGDMPEGVANVYLTRFLPWSRAMAQRPARKGSRFSLFDLAVAVLVDERSLRSLERDLGLRNGSAADLLREALAEYGRPGHT